ncbi:MFS transporter [Bryobacter aggregatus]|uniref:MFS transporter n=1 Tax=Bryobacter aggregatus TaxID=360054 RepID=UPI0004E26510|nr:MFS transporter [Bryobacter aggregatus]
MRNFGRIWGPALALMLVSTISYVDRNAIAVLIPTIQQETGLTGREYGWIVAAFSYAYMLGNPLWGILLDRLGVRSGMTLAVAGWSLASALHALAGGLGSFAVLRTALGFCEGATFPGALRTVMQTLEPERRSRGIALSYSGGSLGAILTPFIVTPIALAFGWRMAFWVTGGAGLVWLCWWWLLCRRPDLAARPKIDSEGFGWKDPRVVAFVAAYAMGAVPLGFILYMAGMYLSQVFGLSQKALGGVLWIPPAGWECGYFFWGWWIDRQVKRGSSIEDACGKAFRIGLVFSLPLAFAPQIASLPLFLGELFLAMFVTGSFIVGGIAYATSAFGNRRAGLIAGLGAGSFSALTAMTAPLFGGFFDQKNYSYAFWVATAFPVAGYLLWVWLRDGYEFSSDRANTPR